MTNVDPPFDWDGLFAEIPRATFIPDTIWADDDSGEGFVALSKQVDPDAWHAAVATNVPVITQVDFSERPGDHIGRVPSSSGIQPSIVADMLATLDVHPGQSVLEIGTGTLERRTTVPPGWRARPGGHD